MDVKMSDMTAEQLKAVEKIEKLLNLAAKAGTSEEAASATAKAQELLAQYNLDSAVLEDTDAKRSAKREEAKIEGGLYAFQRELWRAVARLNFCHYWSQSYIELGKKRRRHALVGRVVNTRATMAMASYLQDAIERLSKERVSEEGWLQSSNWAWSYRKGMAQEVIDRLRDRREEILHEEEIARRKAAKAAADAAPGTALTVASFAASEDEANDDFRFGEGFSAEKRARLAADAAKWARMEAAYTVWAQENPGKAYTKFRYHEDGREYKYTGSGRDKKDTSLDNVDMTAYRLGRTAGEQIGLDPQAGDRKAGQKKISGPKVMHL